VFRTSDILLIALMVSAAAFTYNTKHRAEARLAEVHKIEAEIKYEQDTINLLKADWSLLTQPSRLQKLTDIYQAELQLQPVEARQIGSLDDLPPKPVEIQDFSTQRLGGMADNSKDRAATDHTVTGAVVQ
jgi:cell division protein FtsL